MVLLQTSSSKLPPRPRQRVALEDESVFHIIKNSTPSGDFFSNLNIQFLNELRVLNQSRALSVIKVRQPRMANCNLVALFKSNRCFVKLGRNMLFRRAKFLKMNFICQK